MLHTKASVASILTAVTIGTGVLAFAAPAFAAEKSHTTLAGVNGDVTAVSGSTITIQGGKGESNTIYTIDTSGSTTFSEVAWSSDEKSKTTITLSDIAVGEHVSAHGSLSGTEMNASAVTEIIGSAIRGKVTAVDGSTVTITNKKTGATYTVNVSPSTKFHDVTRPDANRIRTKSKGSLSDITVGKHIRVVGSMTGNTINATNVNLRVK